MTVGIRSPMAGTVIAVDVEVGQTVAAGAVLAVVEAMKMHHSLRAERGGRVQDIRVRRGEIVALDEVVVLLDPSDAGPSPVAGEQQIDLDEIRPDLAAVVERRAKLLDENRPEAVARRHDRGMRTARENIADLTDGGLLVEYGGFAVAGSAAGARSRSWKPRHRPTASSPAWAGSTARCSDRNARRARSSPTTTPCCHHAHDHAHLRVCC